jgi:hypothetical protein
MLSNPSSRLWLQVTWNVGCKAAVILRFYFWTCAPLPWHRRIIIDTGSGTDDWVQFSSRVFLLATAFRPALEPPSLLSKGSRGGPVAKRLEREADHSASSLAEVQSAGGLQPQHLQVLMTWYFSTGTFHKLLTACAAVSDLQVQLKLLKIGKQFQFCSLSVILFLVNMMTHMNTRWHCIWVTSLFWACLSHTHLFRVLKLFLSHCRVISTNIIFPETDIWGQSKWMGTSLSRPKI